MTTDTIETLAIPLCPPPKVSGFRSPFTVDRLCAAFGDNLGGNRPDPSWFEDYEIVIATRRTTGPSIHTPVAAILRRRGDGALRFVASDHVHFRNEYGADFMLAPQHVDVVFDALLEATDDGPLPDAVAYARTVMSNGSAGHGEGPVDILAVRRRRDDLVDIRTARTIAPKIAEMKALIATLSSPDRRSASMRQLENLASEIGIDLDSKDD